MAQMSMKHYFDIKQNNVSEYMKNINLIFKTSDIKSIKCAIAILALWDMFMYINHLAGNEDKGCITVKYLLTIKCKKGMKVRGIIECLYETRNKIAHIADDIEILVGDVADILRSYKYIEDLQEDLDLIFKDTQLTLSAEDVLDVFGISKQYKETKLKDYSGMRIL